MTDSRSQIGMHLPGNICVKLATVKIFSRFIKLSLATNKVHISSEKLGL